MDYSYFPGCTLKNKAQDLDACARAAAAKLGINLIEIENWQCCGAVFPLARDEVATKLSCVRALAAARDKGTPLVTLCSACYNVLKQVNDEIQHDEDFCNKVNNYLRQDEIAYHGETKVMHYLEVLRDDLGWDKVKDAVGGNATFKGKKIGAYYGCLLLRPSKVLKFDDPENPSIIEDFIKAIGATPVIYAQRNECCGAYNLFAKEDEKKECGEDASCVGGECDNKRCEEMVLEANDTTKKRVRTIIFNAHEMGAETLVTSCPLCAYNLEKNLCKSGCVDVVYFSQLLSEALGVKDAATKLLETGYYK